MDIDDDPELQDLLASLGQVSALEASDLVPEFSPVDSPSPSPQKKDLEDLDSLLDALEEHTPPPLDSPSAPMDSTSPLEEEVLIPSTASPSPIEVITVHPTPLEELLLVEDDGLSVQTSSGLDDTHVAPSDAPSVADIDGDDDRFQRTQLEKSLAHAINLLREDPRYYARLLQTHRLPLYQGMKLVLKTDTHRFITSTKEGAVACEEAIEILRDATPVKPLSIDVAMSLAAREAAKRAGEAGTMADSSLEKLKSFGVLSGDATELVGYGSRNGEEFVLSWLISDGDESRTSRKILLDPRWTRFGVSAGDHSSAYQTVAVVNVAKSFVADDAVVDSMLSPAMVCLWHMSSTVSMPRQHEMKPTPLEEYRDDAADATLNSTGTTKHGMSRPVDVTEDDDEIDDLLSMFKKAQT